MLVLYIILEVDLVNGLTGCIFFFYWTDTRIHYINSNITVYKMFTNANITICLHTWIYTVGKY